MPSHEVRVLDGPRAQRWLTKHHYLHRPVIRTKTLAHGVLVDGVGQGVLLWATPHFTKKRELFGMPGTLDKWEVLMLARFYLLPTATITATQAMALSIGSAGGSRSRRRRGWRIQADWCRLHPPVFPQNPFVPRLLISWSDLALAPVDCTCGEHHNGHHQGTIYAASGWELWDTTSVSGQRTDYTLGNGGNKRCWILRLPPNTQVERSYRALA